MASGADGARTSGTPAGPLPLIDDPRFERQATPGRRYVPGKRVAIVQSSYIPWKGYFDLIHSVDEFILFDDVQYTRRDWRNRKRVKTPHGPAWLTIPVSSKGRFDDPSRTSRERRGVGVPPLGTIAANYARAPHSGATRRPRGALPRVPRAHLSAINRRFRRRFARSSASGPGSPGLRWTTSR